MISFRLVHQEKHLLEADKTKISNLGLCFETCLRKIWILPEEDRQVAGDEGDHYGGEDAYQFLLETILGLKSPVFGETEVQGQFKEFLARSGANFFSPWGQMLLEDAKDLRTKELQNLGCQSYGSLLREWTKSFDNIVLVGHGKLAASFIPWLKKKNLFFWVRNPEKVSGYAAHALDEEFPTSFDHANTCVVIAAPLTDESLAKILKNQHFLPVYFDFRERAATDVVYPAHKSLGDISGELAGSEIKFLKIKETIQERVADIALERIHRSHYHRPMGWEDLCV